MLASIRELRTHGISVRDLERARASALAEWRESASSNAGIAGLVSFRLLRDLPLDAVGADGDELQAVTATDVQRAAQRYLSEDALHVVAIGPKELRSSLKDLGLGAAQTRDEWGEPSDK
jgi:predicted Zn-dependent peptidase